MTGTLSFLGGLLAVVVLHLAGVAFVPYFGAAVDLFVVWIVLWAARGDELAGMLAGVATGLAEDALAGSLYGLHGFAGTLIGFAAASTSRRLQTSDAGVVGLLALAAQPLHEVVVAMLLSLLVPEAPRPELLWIGVRTLSSATLAACVFLAWGRLGRRWDDWQKTRPRKVKIG